MYKDEIEKIRYYVQKLIDLNARNGNVIGTNEINRAIDDIDTRVAIFRQAYIEEGETLDIEKFNEQKVDIYEDLKILYKLVFDIAEKRMTALEEKIEYQLEEMYAETNKYRQRNLLETLSIYGKTIFYQSSGFNQSYKDGKVIIDLGEIYIPSGSYLACLLNCPDIKNENVFFIFDDELKTADYRANRNFLKIEGTYKINTHSYESDEVYSNGFEVPVKLKPKDTNIYTLYAGENRIRISYPKQSTVEYYEKKPGIVFEAKEECEISFYVYGSTTIDFDMNDKYSYRSFNKTSISAPRHREKIVIKCNPGFILDFVTDGKIFAEKSRCRNNGEKIISEHGFNGIRKYLLEEIAYGPDVKFDNVKVVITDVEDLFYDIESVAIKYAQISELDGEIEI